MAPDNSIFGAMTPGIAPSRRAISARPVATRIGRLMIRRAAAELTHILATRQGDSVKVNVADRVDHQGVMGQRDARVVEFRVCAWIVKRGRQSPQIGRNISAARAGNSKSGIPICRRDTVWLPTATNPVPVPFRRVVDILSRTPYLDELRAFVRPISNAATYCNFAASDGYRHA